MQDIQQKIKEEGDESTCLENKTSFWDFFALLMKIDKRVNPDLYKFNNKSND